MGLLKHPELTPLLAALQRPATSVKWGVNSLGLSWFINPAGTQQSAAVWKDGDLDGTNTYIAFLPSADPGATPSRAGVFVLVNADGVTDDQTNAGTNIACALANDLLLIMQGQTPPQDKSVYPRSIVRRRRPPPPGHAAAR